MSRLRFNLLLSLAFFLLLTLRGYSEAEAAVLSVSCPNQTVELGEETAVEVVVKDASGLVGFQFDLTYNRNILELQTASLSQGISSTRLGPLFTDLDNDLKRIRIGGYAIGGVILSDNQSHSLVTLRFKANQEGLSQINLSEIIFLDKSTNRISLAYENSSLMVIKPNQAPILSPIGNKQINEGSLLEFTISATDPDGNNLTYSVNNLPQGASFNNSTFSWMPTYDQAGSYEVTFTVSDGKLTDEETVSIKVVDVPQYLASISGRVLEVSLSTRTKPVAEAKVILVGLRQSRQVTTDNQGRYKIQNLPEGRYQLTASKQGYRAQSHSLILNRNQKLLNIDFYLKPTSP